MLDGGDGSGRENWDGVHHKAFGGKRIAFLFCFRFPISMIWMVLECYVVSLRGMYNYLLKH